ncbi:MAG: family 78 glycoside hydrolase catalytic domain [Prevotella sp.]|nr:family 78 glycoside hydrolase catalytic domain [Prevotella sp.]
MKKLFLFALSAFLSTLQATAEVYDLLCENLREPLGIDTTQPHFSWKHTLTHVGQQQTAYELQVGTDVVSLADGHADLWDSGKVSSAEQVLIPYEGKPLTSRQLCYWRLRTWDEDGHPSAWTQPQRFAIGILDGMPGNYIGYDGAVTKVRTGIHVDNLEQGPVFAHVNSLGYHEVFVNGRRVGDYVLQPAVSQLDRHSLIVTYDISSYLHSGDNDIIVWLGQGWYKSTTFKAQYNYPLLKADICQLVQGTWQTLSRTGTSWQASLTGYSYTDNWWPLHFGGERLNANVAEIWHPAKCYDLPDMKATPQLFEGNRIIDRLEPQDISEQADGSVVIDFGRVITGWLHADFESLPKNKNVTMEYTDYIPVGGTFESQGESDIYISNGKGSDSFCNRFHHHAFRYVRISGATVDKVEALQLSALPKSGNVSTFSCSDDQLNAIHDMIHYTMQCLTFSGYMVDCPHLERTGYGGDGNSSTMTLQTMYDVAPTYMNWLSAWSDNVDADGSLPHVAPAGGGGGGPYWCGFFIKAPWRMYLNYGDRRPMERYYEQMKLWFDYVDKYTVDGLLQPWPDTDNRMWFLGDWLAPDGVDVGGESVIHANNCFVSDCLGNMATMARILGRDDEARQFESRRQARNEAIHAKYLHDDYYANGTQLDQSYAVIAGVPADDAELRQVNQRLIRDCRVKYRGHIAAGLFGVPVFTEWAVRQRQTDLMADILRQPDYPGYLHMINNGATTTWEYWNGERSRVHNCYNGIGTWFYQALAGIRSDGISPGYQHFIIDPQTAGGITACQASKPTPYGPTAVRWTLDDEGAMTLDVTVPVGTTATVCVPAAEGQTLYDGNRKANEVEGNTYLGYENQRQQYLVGAGRHVFSRQPTTDIRQPKNRKNKQPHLTVWPNPASDELHWTADTEVTHLTLYSMKGQPHTTPHEASTINLSGLDSGTYILAATTPTGTLTAKVIKK